ncbi:DMT family transporter [Nocardioides sp.]|uniref:DMT family transporter n=1 Tax=Nocardioides sp. TaxID=35761 RepID=UPI0035188225
MLNAGGPRADRPGWGLAQVCLAGVLWGTGGLAVEVVRDHAPLSPLTISAWRVGIAALVLAAAALLLRRGPAVRDLMRTRPALVVTVGGLTALYQALYFAGVVAVGVSVSTVVSLGVAPVLLAVRDAVVARRVPTPAAVVPVVAALTGLVLVSVAGGGASTGSHPVLGVVASLGSGTAYALATVLGERAAQDADPLVLTCATTTVGAAGMVPVALLVALVAGDPVATGDPAALLTLLYLGAATFALAYALLYAGLRTTSSSAAVLASLLEPVTAALAAAVVLDERLGVLGVLGVVAVLGAVASLARRPSAQTATAAADPVPPPAP